MKVKKQWKLVCASLLTACCIGTAAAGFALAGGGRTANAAASDKWVGLPAKSAMVGDEILTVTDNAAIVNKTDILQLPNSTGVFYMYYNDSVEWSGFTLRNGCEAVGYSWVLTGASETAFPWHTVGFEGKNNHMILQDNRKFPSSGGTYGGLKGVEGENFKNGFIPIEIHVGQGAASEDPSYIKIGGVELIHEQGSGVSVTQSASRETGTCTELVSSLFTEGAYLAINYNGRANPLLAISEPGSVVATNVSMDMTKQEHAGAFSKDLTMDLSSAEDVFGDGCTVTVKLNGKVLSSVTPEVTTTDDNKHATLKVTKAQLDAIDTEDLETSSYLTFSFDNGDKHYGDVPVALSILFEDPPVVEESDIALEKKEPFSVSFTYAGVADPETGLSVSYQLNSASPEESLTKDTDYTITKADSKYTVTFTEAGVEKLFNGHNSSTLVFRLGKHVFNASVYVEGQTTEYGIRFREGIDYVGDSLKIDEYYASAKIHRLDTSILASRVFYENGVDVTKPIFIEYGTLDPKVEWMLISLMSTPTISEYFTETTAPSQGNVFSFIVFGQGRNNLQGMNGTFVNGNTTEHAKNTNMKNNVVEISLGATNAADGYVKINGQKVEGAVPAKSQADFPSGKAWVGFFFNNGGSEFDFICNTHVNAVAITSPQADSEYKMDLGKAVDFSVDLVNTSGNLKLKDESGKEIPSSQYSYEGGKLTIKAEYFSSKSYVKDGQIFIWDNEKETGTAFKMEYTNSDMGTVRIAYAVKGGTENVAFDLGIESVTSVTQDGEPVSEDKYTVEGGKFIVKATSIPAEVGAYEFLVNANGSLYPCYVYVDNFANGYAAAAGAVASENGYTLTGVTSVTEAKTYDLTEGYEVKLSFKTIDGYYERGVNEKATSVTLRFYDPVTAQTLVITVFANFEDDKITSSNQALFISYALYDAAGTKLSGGSERPVAPTDGNNSASGVHALEVAEKSGGLTITLAGRPYNLSASALGNFGLKACVLTVTTENSTSGSVAELTVGESTPGGTTPGGTTPGGTTPGGDDNPGNTPGGTTPGGDTPSGNENGDSSGEEGGCGSVIFAGFGAAVAALVLAVGAAVLIVVRRKEDK